MIVVSIDPTEGTDLAAAKKRSYLHRYGHPETAAGWHFLTGTQANIDALTKAVGFGYVKIPGPDGRLTQFAHASSIQIVTPEGKLAQYYMGCLLYTSFSGKDRVRQGESPGSRRRDCDRVPAGVPGLGNYFRQHQRQAEQGSEVTSGRAQLPGACRSEYASADQVCGRGVESEPGTRSSAGGTSAGEGLKPRCQPAN